MKNPYKDKLIIELRMRGFIIREHGEGRSMSSLIFENGTVDGMIGIGSKEVIYLITVRNTVPQNGQFASVMDKLEELACTLHFTFYVVHIWNESFAQHLINKRGYVHTEEKDGYHLIYKKSVPETILRQVEQLAGESSDSET